MRESLKKPKDGTMMKRPVTDEALLEAYIEQPVRVRRPLNPKRLYQLLDHMEECSRALSEQTERFRRANDSLEAFLYGNGVKAYSVNVPRPRISRPLYP